MLSCRLPATELSVAPHAYENVDSRWGICVPKLSAGILMFRKRGTTLEVFLVHPGGPFWRNKDAGAWSIPKGEYGEADDALEAAKREFREETGFEANGDFLPLGKVKQAGGKIVTAWAVEGNCSPAAIRSNTFSIEWPPKSSRQQEFPEVDRAAWFNVTEANKRILKGQLEFLNRLAAQIAAQPHTQK
jgi:predicted NUDIX family NTP pyrophosphohydrolase